MSNRKRSPRKPVTDYSNDKMLNRYEAKNLNQQDYLKSIINNILTIAYGPSGVGKTALALCLMCEHLVEDKIDKIIVTKPFVESSPKGLGYIPGKLEDKVAPYLQYFNEYMEFFLGKIQFRTFVSLGKIKILPIEYLRGSTFNDCYIFGDELQNATYTQCKLLITRLGHNSKLILNGDPTQTDLNSKFESGFLKVISKLNQLKDVGIIRFNNSDILRNDFLSVLLSKLDE